MEWYSITTVTTTTMWCLFKYTITPSGENKLKTKKEEKKEKKEIEKSTWLKVEVALC